MKPWLTIREAVIVTRVPRSTIQDWIAAGEVTTRKVMLGRTKYRLELDTRDLIETEAAHWRHTDPDS